MNWLISLALFVLQITVSISLIDLWYEAFVLSLPDELQLKILAYLSPGDLLVCARVCKHWNYLANDKWVFSNLNQQCAVDVIDVIFFKLFKTNWSLLMFDFKKYFFAVSCGRSCMTRLWPKKVAKVLGKKWKTVTYHSSIGNGSVSKGLSVFKIWLLCNYVSLILTFGNP